MKSRRSWKSATSRSNKRKKRTDKKPDGVLGLEARVADGGGRSGFGLDGSTLPNDRNVAGVYGRPATASTHSISRLPTRRLFSRAGASVKSHTTSGNNNKTNNPYAATTSSRRSIASAVSSSRLTNKSNVPAAVVHIVCAISENLAKETCVASLDAGSPVSLHVTKQGNGQTYAETLAYLEVLQPDEVLLNEGRRHSQLAKKILALYSVTQTVENPLDRDRTRRTLHQVRAASRRTRVFAQAMLKGDGGSDEEDDVERNHGPCTTCTVVKFVPRAYFDQTKGAELLRRIARSDTYDASYVDEYILLSSSHAVLQYTQLCLGANFASNCLHLTINTGGNNRMTIDRSSLLHLELLANAKTGKTGNSLIGTIDLTKTAVGSRLLRTNLMAPPTQTDTINCRLDLVDTFLGDEQFFYTVMEHLEALPDVNKMLTNIALVPWKKGKRRDEQPVTPRIASKGISALVCIKSSLSAVPALERALQDQLSKLEIRDRSTPQQPDARQNQARVDDNVSVSTHRSSLMVGLGAGSSTGQPLLRHQLLRAILITLEQPQLAEVLAAVADIFTESTSYSRNAHAMRHQECFALKPKTDGMMDVLRKAFLANVDDIYRLADEYAETYGINVTVKENVARGYYLAIPADMASELPNAFIQPVRSGRAIHCTTEEVHSLNSRAQDNVQDLLLMTHDRIQEVLDTARAHYDMLASLSDAIALLDMCHCFADNVASSRLPWCRPIVGQENHGAAASNQELRIRNGRYGIDVSSTGVAASRTEPQSAAGDFIPNDTYANQEKHFTVITGVNGSGKSTYLKQLAIIVVLGHCGSYVPAEQATIPARDRLCTRIGTADDQEHNISTFMLEMKEAAFICSNATPRSLILIDELGRATSNEDGVAIAWSVAEHLLSQQAMTFFVTHYPQLTKLGEAYPAVQNQHMGAGIADDELTYTHKILPGPCMMSADYGVDMALSCGWPSDVIRTAKTIRTHVDEKLPDGSLSLVQTQLSQPCLIAATESLKRLGDQLLTVKKSVPDDDMEIWCRELQELRVSCKASLDADAIEALKYVLRETAQEEKETEEPDKDDTKQQGEEPSTQKKTTIEQSNDAPTDKESNNDTASSLSSGTISENSSSSGSYSSDDSSSSEDDAQQSTPDDD